MKNAFEFRFVRGVNVLSIKKVLLYLTIISLLVLSACGTKEKDKEGAKIPNKETEQVANQNVDDENENDDTTNDEEDTGEDNTVSDEKEKDKISTGEVLNPYIEELTGGDIEVVFTNNEPDFTHAYSDQVKMTIDQYQIVHVTNMNESAKSYFDGEEEGYVLTLQMTLDNQSEDEVSYAGGISLLTDDATENIRRSTTFVDREQWLKDDSTEGASLYSKGTFTGFDAFMITKDQFEKSQLPILKIDALWRGEDVSDRIGEQGVLPLPFSDAGIEKAKATADLYPDKMLTDSIAEKEVFFAKEDINESQTIDKVKVTLNGVQYANITPTDGHKERFKNFGDGPLVALTAKFTIENNSDVPFEQFLIDRRLHIDDRGSMTSQGMLEPTVRGSVEPGDTFQGLAVFLFREDEFGIYKELKLQIGPLADENAKRLFKEKSVTFELPMK